MSAHLKHLNFDQSSFNSLPISYNSISPYIKTHMQSTNPLSFSQFYTHAPNPLATIVPLLVGSSVGAYVLGLIFSNVSQIDRMWTFLPVLYSAHFALWPWMSYNGEDYSHNKGRVLLMLLLQIMWSMRLSYNTFRRGLFGFFDEDYRWAIWRELVPNWVFQLFHIGFIIILQGLLLVAIALPVQMAVLVRPDEVHTSSLALLRSIGLTGSDLLVAGLSLGVLYTQWCSDNQQYSFQNYKIALKDVQNAKDGKSTSSSSGKKNPPSQIEAERSLSKFSSWNQEFALSQIKWTPSDAARGFVTRGLWSWSRHPNFACEQSFWTLQALFPLLASVGGLVGEKTKRELGMSNPLWGAFALSMLFAASTNFTESISAKKYPEYKTYQKLVGEFCPQATIAQGLFWGLLGKKREMSQRVFGQSRRKQPVK